MKVTVPVFVKATAVEEVTVAVNVTSSGGADGFFEDTSAVEVFDLLTTCETVFDVLVVKVKSVMKTAVIGCVPTGSAAVVKVATPLEFTL